MALIDKSTNKITVRVPATTANLGPGFDSLGLALDMWNETTFQIKGIGYKFNIRGEGETILPKNEYNLIIRSAKHLFNLANQPFPTGLEVTCTNNIPLNSGLGSSAAATLTGLLVANAMLDNQFSAGEIIKIGSDLEGHPDNITPAMLGGLTITASEKEHLLTKKVDCTPLSVIIVMPDVMLSTQEARDALPPQVSLADAIHNLSRTPLIVLAFQAGDIDLLQKSMDDRLHQPYRLDLIPGALSAITAARELGAATALSGAGPSMVAFCKENSEDIRDAIIKNFEENNLTCRSWITSISPIGAAY